MTYQVESYSILALKALFAQCTVASASSIEKKLHTIYFEEYFRVVDARTIVVEKDYIDHDYLEDYSAYYVKCFQHYRRECTRLHFFKKAFSAGQFERLLGGAGDLSVKELEEGGGYLGFIVLKPLPQSIIGRTCLTQYPTDGRRQYPATRDYTVHLYGIELRVNTLAFQEQDSVASACATSAIWSALQATSKLYQHYLPSPVEITKAATTNQPLRSRAFPNDGLTAEQMAHAIRSVGLEPLHVQPENLFILKALVYGYLRAGIPALLIHRLVGVQVDGSTEEIGNHAVAVTGYSLPPTASGSSHFTSDRIDRLYVHDDQVGPFARMTPGTDAYGRLCLSTSWGLHGSYSEVRAEPYAVLMPLYNKIRIPFQDVYEDIVNFDRGFAVIRDVMGLGDIEWDVYLTTISDLKRDIRGTWPVTEADRHSLTTRSFPRFVWHASARIDGEPAMEVVFDATDIASGKYIRLMHVYDSNVVLVLDQFRIDSDLRASEIGQDLARIFDKCCLVPGP